MKRYAPLLIISIFLLVFTTIVYFAVHEFRRERRWTPENVLVNDGSSKVSDDLSRDSLITAADQSLKYLRSLDGETAHPFGKTSITNAKIIETIEDLKKKIAELGDTEELHRYIEEHYDFYKTAAPSVLFTGYFEASLSGSRKRDDRYRYPIYRKPIDLVDVALNKDLYPEAPPDFPAISKGRIEKDKVSVPYFSREEIDYERKLEGKGLEIAWVDDPLSLFFLHIQGSGVINLEDGSKIQVSFADRNGYPYRVIGKYLIDKGALKREEVSMQSIKDYLNKHPERWREVLTFNQSYVFFREVPEGPLGNINVTLTPNRSIATDSELFPRGALALIEAEKPIFDADGKIVKWEQFRRLVLNQDTGGAIRGPGKVDLFTGSGKVAEEIAGHMKSSGTFYFLIKK